MKNSEMMDCVKTIFKCFLCVVAVYLLFTPVFYLYNKNFYSVGVYIIASVLQFLAVAVVGNFYRRKNSSMFSREQTQHIWICVLCALVVMIVLHIAGMPDRWYGVLTSSLDIYHTFADNLFVIVLIERLCNSYLVTSFLICMAIAFYRPARQRNRAVMLSPEHLS